MRPIVLPSLSVDSKYGRPPAKKVKDRKPSTRLASNSNTTPSDITGSSSLLAFQVPIFYHIHDYPTVLPNTGKFFLYPEYLRFGDY